MSSGVLGDFLRSVALGPSALMLEGEAGIGKTTLWLVGVEQARAQGFTVLSTRPVAAESVLAYASLADLLGGVDPTIWTELPAPQRLAVDQVLLRGESDPVATDQRAVSAAFLSVVSRLAEDEPVLLAMDDLQWLDSSSLQVISFVTRRLTGPVGVLGAVRTEAGTEVAGAWLQLPRPEAIQRLQVEPLTLGGLHPVLSERLGRSLSRPTLTRIHDISGGNPFYALELARSMGESSADMPHFPGSLAELVQARIGGLGSGVQDALLAAACATAPTVDLVAQAIDADATVVAGLLEAAEASGIIEIAGHRIRFTHPLLAQGVYAKAVPAQRRAVHRRLADIVTQPELRARHLALGTMTSDPETLQALDEAAEIARRRGAPAAAAELLDLAMGLGGDTPERRILLARHHLDAGDLGRARVLLEETIDALAPGVLRAAALNLLALVRQVDDSFVDAVALLTRALCDVGDDLALRVEILVAVSYASLLVGDLAGALRHAEDALAEGDRLGQSQLLGQSIGVRVMLGALAGEGVDEARMRRALALEDTGADVTVFYRPCFNNVMVLSWLGRIEEARVELESIRSQCLERGEETALIVTGFNYVVGAGWLGAFPEATLVAEDSMERALLVGRDQSLMMALTGQAVLAAYAGRADDARRFGGDAIAASYRGGALFLLGYQLTAMGFLELSLGNHAAALAVLEPLIQLFHASPQATEIGVAAFMPDAVEAFVALGRFDEAEPLVAALERNGARLDRAWMLAMGARGRAMLLAADGDVDAASSAAQQAMSEHDRLPMPFERARTQLLLGQLLRRQKQKDAASTAMREALATFETLGTPLWADKARAALARSNVGPKTTPGLTPSEQRVAELAATGMTNRDVAAELFISPKTVEANLSRIYHKLGIRSRAELGRLVGRPDA